MNVIMPAWEPSERLRRLAERRGVTIGAYVPTSSSQDIPLIDAVIAARGKLSGHAYGKLESYVIDRPAYARENPDAGIPGKTWHNLVYRAVEFNKQYPTLRAFQDGLRRDDPVIRHMHMVGPKILAEYRHVFLGEV